MVLSMMDDPRHARIRRLVSAGLTPRTVGRLETELRRRTTVLLHAVEDDVPFDFVVESRASCQCRRSASCSASRRKTATSWERSSTPRRHSTSAETPTPHLALGRGVHYCLGANIARLEMRVMFEELLGRFGGIELAGDVEWTRSNRHSGIRHLPLRMRR